MAVVVPLFDLVSIFGEINNCVLGNQNSLATIDVAPTGQHDAARRENTNSRFLRSLANQFDGVIAAACPSIQNKRLDFCTHDQHAFTNVDACASTGSRALYNPLLRIPMKCCHDLAIQQRSSFSATFLCAQPQCPIDSMRLWIGACLHVAHRCRRGLMCPNTGVQEQQE